MVQVYKTLKMYGDVGIAEQQKVRKQAGMMAYNSSVYNPILHIFPHNTCMMRKVCRVLYTELFYAIIPACFTFCCSAIATSPYIFNVFTLVLFTSFL